MTPPRPHLAPVALLVAALMTTGVTCDRGARDPRSVERSGPSGIVLVSVDTLRADALGAYGARPSVTPRIDGLAAEGTTYLRASSPMPLTRPAHFTMLTSRNPRVHGVVNNVLALPPAADVVTALLAGHGYRTAAFVSVTLLDGRSGAAQGFERLSAPSEDRDRPCEATVAEATAWVRSLDDSDRFFLWTHLFDPHLPYTAGPPDGPTLSWKTLEAIADAHDGDVPAEILSQARDLYRSEVERVDACVGELVDAISRSRALDDVLIVFTADHGECFEGGIYFEHADCLLDGAIDVPLILRYPGRFAAGRRVETPAGLVDVAPTILDVAGIAIPAAYTGIALSSTTPLDDRTLLVQHPIYNERAVMNRSARRERLRSVAGQPVTPIVTTGDRVGVVGRDWKLVQEGGSSTLHRRGVGAAETVDHAAQDVEQTRTLETALDAALEAQPLRILDPGAIDDELLEALRALGYAG